MVDVRIALIRDWLSGELGWRAICGWNRPQRCQFPPLPASGDLRIDRRGHGRSARQGRHAPPISSIGRVWRACAHGGSGRYRVVSLPEDLAAPTCLRYPGPVANRLATVRHWPPRRSYRRAAAGGRRVAAYDARRSIAMQLLPAWPCACHLRLTGPEDTGLCGDSNFDRAADAAGGVQHRDYHSRN
jgi:hypothetical protein